jgi:predicted enzyme related to lactoylglutathione lyase
MATCEVGSVVMNVVDIEREQAFWSALLDAEPVRSVSGFFVWQAPQHLGGISVALQRVFEPKVGRNRVHLDTGVEDLEAAQRRIEELGGSHVVSHAMGGVTWRVMADPEGNEFGIAQWA